MRRKTIAVAINNKTYEFYNVPIAVAKAVVTLLRECENDEVTMVSAESTNRLEDVIKG